MTNRVFAVGVLAGLSLVMAKAQDPGGLTGTVVTADDQKPLGAAWVVAMRTDAGGGQRTYSTQATNDGSFSLAQLPKGTYTICAQLPGGGVLDPCQWGATGAQAMVSAGQTTGGVSVALPRGQTLHVRVNDSGKMLAAFEGKTNGANLLIGIFSKGMFHPLPKISGDDQGRDYEMTIPADTDLAFSASSGYFDMDDVSGDRPRWARTMGS